MKLLILILALQAHAAPTDEQRAAFLQGIEDRHNEYMLRATGPREQYQYFNISTPELDFNALIRSSPFNQPDAETPELDVYDSTGNWIGSAE